jgi:hypothetical protein
MRQDAAAKVRLDFVRHEGGQFATSRFQIFQERRPVFLCRSVKQSRFRTMARARAHTHERVVVTACRWLPANCI